MKCSAVGISTEGTGASTPFVSSMYSSRSSSQSSSMPEVSASRETTTTTAPLDLLAAAAATVAAEFSCFPAPTRPLEEDAHRPWNSSSGTTAAASNSRHSHHPTALLALSNNTAYTIFPPSFTTTNSISPSTVVTDISNMRPMDCWNPAIQTNRIGNHQHYHYYTLSLPALQYHPHHHPRHNHNQARQQQQQQHSNNKTNCKEKQPYLCYRDAARKEKAEANAVAKLNEEAKAHDEAKSQAKAKNINEEAKEKALLKELSFLYRPYSAALRESSVCGSSASLSSSSAARTNYKKRKLNDISPLAYHGGGGTALEALEQSQYRKVTRLNREADHLQGFPPPPTTITDINQEAIPPIDEGSRAARGALVEATKQHWTRREDDIFVKFVQSCGELGGTNNNRYWTDKRYWNHLAQLLPGREAQHCRTRWAQHLDPSIVKGNWTLTEDLIILTTIESHGFKWVRMSQRMPGRTDNSIKNRWHSSMKPKVFSYLSFVTGLDSNTISITEAEGQVAFRGDLAGCLWAVRGIPIRSFSKDKDPRSARYWQDVQLFARQWKLEQSKMDFAAAFPVSQALLIRRKQADEHEQSTLGIVTSSPSHVSLQQPYSQIVRGQTVPHRLPTKLIQHV